MMSNTDLSVTINPYHYNNILLFQFILKEFMETFKWIEELQTLCRRAPIPSSGYSFDECTQKELEFIFNKLMGFNRDYTRLIAWNCHGGTLSKLKLYCGLFIKNSDEDEKEMVAMQHYVDKAYQSCQKSIDLLKEENVSFALLLASIEKTTASIQRFTKAVTRLIHHFSSNENVLFYVLRHRHAFDKIYGRGFVAKQFCRLFPKGIHEAQRLLSDKYLLRGFDNIVPIIAAKILDSEMSSL